MYKLVVVRTTLVAIVCYKVSVLKHTFLTISAVHIASLLGVKIFPNGIRLFLKSSWNS